MRTVLKNIYQFSELSESAKEYARNQYRCHSEWAWSDESRESIQAFCAHFGVALKKWHCSDSDFDYSHDAKNDNFRGMKLSDFDRDYMPTGYCLDCDLWCAFYDVFKTTGSAKIAFDSALWEGFKAWKDDLQSQTADEYIDETIECNNYEYDENGVMI